MADANGAFETEIGIAPGALFDSLMIDESWTKVTSRLDAIART